MTTRFCTLFDVNYAARGLVMLESLARHHPQPFEVYVLALDEGAHRLAQQLGRGAWRVLAIADLGDDELMALQGVRPHREFCWTCTPAFLHRMVQTAADGDVVCYADADMMFFADPQILLDELAGGGNVLIHEHRYSPDKEHLLAASGRFNVGFVAFRVGEESRGCVSRWRQQTVACCEFDPERGLCGDQAYLNEWPGLYPGLRIMQNIGGGVAPWNVNANLVSRGPDGPAVDGVPVVFYHYHAFKLVTAPGLGAIAAVPAQGYAFPPETRRHLYKPYVRAMRDALARTRFAVQPRSECSLSHRELLSGLVRGQVMTFLPPVSRAQAAPAASQILPEADRSHANR